KNLYNIINLIIITKMEKNKDNPPPTKSLEEINIELKSNTENNKAGLTYTATSIIGSGSFGVVYQATIVETGEVVAIKKVFQDRRYKNRELQIMKEWNHPNIIKWKNYFYTPGDKPDEIYLNCVMDYVPESCSKIIRNYFKAHQQINMLLIKLYSFQMLKSLAYIHAIGICHRDIKPQNIWINTSTHVVKWCDFGSAKKLIKGQPNIAYICSRYYRAPEWIFGATEYSNQIDVWSIGCVIAELIWGQPIFPGDSASDQWVEIIKILGTPTKEQILEMNPQYQEHKFPMIKPYSWTKVFKNKLVADEYIDLIDKLLVYEPNKRLTPMKALCHPFFDELKWKTTKLPNGEDLPNELYQFTKEEIELDPDSSKLLMNTS
ncbi:MAG: GSK family serine/threonine-protein kinase, partial [Mycoplasma sp.]